jgi:TonB-linked SusC/RagA family outer membrane protein
MLAMPNFLQQQMIMRNNQSNTHLLGNAYVDFEIIKGLHLRSSINGDLGAQDYNAYFGTMFGYNGNPPPRSLASATAYNLSNNSYSWLNENLLSYTNSFGDHNFDVLAGYTTQKFSMNSRSINGTGFASDAVPWISGATTTTGSSTTTTWTLASALARINYDYKKRYYLSATIRNDGSSRFGSNKKYGTFPSVSAGWVVSDEAFFPRTNTVSFLKLKGSYGLTGNNNLGNANTQNYPAITLLSPANYVFNGTTTTGQAISSLGNPNLTWETSKQTDVGLEMNFLKNRISFTYDYYNKRTEDMLSVVQLPFASGYTSMSYNVGVFRIWGHEFQVSSKNMVGEFTWSTDFNISFNDNKVISLVNNTPIGGTNKYYDYNRTAVGHHIGEFYGYVFEGIYMNASDFAKYPHETSSEIGSVRMKDVNGDDTITISDRTFIGNPNPKYIFGISNNFTYKNFDLNIIAAGQVGNKLMNVNLQNIQNLDGAFNLEKDMANRWRSEANPGNGKVPRTKSTSTELYRMVNTNWVFSGDYLTIKNIALGYTIRQKALRFIKSVRVYGSVQNAFVFTKYPGQNPEVNDNKDNQTVAGLDNGSFPNPRTFMVGANINF